MMFALSKRRLLPKWRKVATTLNMAESQVSDHGPSRPLILDSNDLQKAISAWKENPTSGHFGDVLAFSISVKHKDVVRQVAEEAILHKQRLSSAQKIFVNSLLSSSPGTNARGRVEQSAEEMGVRVRDTRKAFNIDPSNPLTLLDMAQLRLASGDAKTSERYIRSAKQLAPNNRLVLRTLARYLAHVGKFEEGHRLLAAHERTAHDPWLMASEIAMAQLAETHARSIRLGHRVLKEKNLSHANTTELAGALAGIELVNGNYKRAREFFRTALVAPNDNVIAQFVTDQRSLSIDASASIDGSSTIANPYEAQALLAWERVDFNAAFNCGMKWHAEEPFSSRPLQFLSSFLSASAKYSDSIVLARRGLVADPGDKGLGVNLSYALACTNQLDEAEKIVKRTISVDSNRFAAQSIATIGLIAMKRGDFAYADKCYLEALTFFSKNNERELYAVCRAYYARAAVDCGHPQAEIIIKAAAEEYKKNPLPDSAFILKSLEVELASRKVLTQDQRMVQWEFNKEKAELVRRTVMADTSIPLVINRKDESSN